MKKILGLLLALAMLLPLTAIAEDTTENTAVTGVTANGVVESENTYDITAPFSGTLLPFTWKRGDSVKAGDALFVIDTVKVYAPTDGTLRAVFVEEGDAVRGRGKPVRDDRVYRKGSAPDAGGKHRRSL